MNRPGRRPALVLSHAQYNFRSGLFITCPTTNQIKDYPFEVIIPDGLKVSGVVLSDQVKSLDWGERKVEYVDDAPHDLVIEVIAKVNTSF